MQAIAHRTRSRAVRVRAHERVALGPAAALSAWGAVLVALNATSHGLVAGATFTGLATLAIGAGLRQLLALSLVVGIGMLVVVPGIALVDGSFRIAFAGGATELPDGGLGWLLAVGGALRVPAQVLAAAFLVLVPGELLLAAAGRLSPRTALLGGLASRLRPLLARDLRLTRDELASRGLRIGREAPVRERTRAVLALWEAAISGMLDRAFQTAAALETRGYGAARPTTDSLSHPQLVRGAGRSAGIDVALVVVALALVASVVTARAAGLVPPPMTQPFAAGEESTPALVAAAAVLGLLLGMLPLAGRSGSVRVTATITDRALAPTPLELRVQSAGMRYPASATPSLVEATFHVAPGELVVAAGASGSGKSTMLDVVTGVAPRATGGVRSGVVRLGAHVLGAARGPAEARIAAVFQDPESQVLVGTVAEEVAFGLRHAGLPLATIEQRVVDVLDQLQVRHLASRDCATLSGGELQRVLLAAALALEPALLVLDEPTSQVDADSERRFWDAVDRARAERGIGVIVAEHRLDHVLRRADRVLVFDAGRIVATVLPSELQAAAPHLLGDAYRGLVPAPPERDAAARLVVRLERLCVEGDVRGGRTLLRGLSFGVPPRSVVTLEGPNGTGKSTLLRAIRGLHQAAGGVLVDGTTRGEVGASVRQLAYLSQGAGGLLPGRSVGHAVEETCRRLGIDVAAARMALASSGLADRRTSHPSELSVGERQRLALVAATAHRPPVWLLDEPTRGMDAAARRWAACHMLAHASAGGVVLVATHDPSLAAAIATHRLRLDLRTGPSLIAVQRDAAGHLLVQGGTRGSLAAEADVVAGDTS